jgi:predicted type IV restriction endonuclease
MSAKSRDVNESDTVIIITDLLSELFGYDKYSEITSEHAIRGTFCDLAINLEGTVQFLIEAKAIGTELKDSHVKQAVDYAANKGIDWVLLTNGVSWRIYKVTFTKPIDQELVTEIDFLKLNPKSTEDLELLYLLTKEGWQKKVLGDFHEQRQALSRFFIGAMVLSEPVLNVIRRELRKVSPDVKVQNEQIECVLLHEVLKREVVEGEKADEARKKISRAVGRVLRARTKEAEEKPADRSAVVPISCLPPVGGANISPT